MFTRRRTIIPILACALAFVLWGFNTPAIIIGLEQVPMMALLAVKYTFGAVVFVALAWRGWRPLKGMVRTRILLATGSGYVLASIFFYLGAQMTGGLNAALIYLLAPMVLFFLSIQVLKERFNSRLLFGLIVGLAGALLILGAPLLVAGGASHQHLLGNILIVLAILTDAAGTILIKPALKSVSPLQMTAVRFAIAAVVFIPLALIYSPAINLTELTTATWLAIGYNLIFATLISFYLYHWSLSRMSAEQSSPLTYLDPTMGAVASMVVLGEQMTTIMMVGTALVIGGLYFGERKRRNPKHYLSHHR
jgi:drug/metabolite transporter (DMT)-like permease